MNIEDIVLASEPDNQLVLNIETSNCIFNIQMRNGSYPRFYEPFWDIENTSLIDLIEDVSQRYEQYVEDMKKDTYEHRKELKEIE